MTEIGVLIFDKNSSACGEREYAKLMLYYYRYRNFLI